MGSKGAALVTVSQGGQHFVSLNHLKTTVMRIINVVKIKLGVVDEIESFGVIEEQLVDEVVEQAEKAFLKAAKEMGADTEDEDVVNELLDNAYYEIADNDGPFVEQQSVCLSWSDIDN